MLTQKRFTLLVLVVAIFLSTFVLFTPKPNTTDETTFNTRYAMATIASISQEEHSVYDPDAHEEVRLYLKERLTDYLGWANVYEYDYELYSNYDIHNLLGVIEGNSDTAIMLVGHYDSRGPIGLNGELGNSYGAADDGYAIATLLEIARLYRNRDIENTIYILITDGEETGLWGAEFAAQETALMENVGFIINIEARGVKGPAYMFETSTNNNRVLDFYTNANYPVSYSLATAVYTVMPNNTDFTEFLAIDKNGLNFAVLDSLYYYHTPHDNYTNISPSSIEHYGQQILPLVEEFVTNSEYSDVDYFDGTHDDIFFTLFPNVFIKYSETTGTIFHIFFLLILIGLIIFSLIKKDLSPRKIGKSFALFGAMMGIFMAVGYIVARIVAFYSKVNFSITYVYTNIGGIPTLIVLVGLTYLFYRIYQKKHQDLNKEIMVAGTLFNLVLALVSGLVLSGASFLFLVIGIIGTIYLYIETFTKNYWARQVVYSLVMIIAALVILPILYSLYLALTVGGLLAFGLILSFYLIVLIPIFQSQYTLKQ